MALVSQLTTNPVFWNGTAYTCINLPAGIQVSSGSEGVFAVRAHQIGWGDSTFNGNTFGGTSQGLLSAIESAIENKTVDLSNYTTYSYVTAYAVNAAFKAVEAHENAYGHITPIERENLQSAYEVAYFAYNRLNTFLDGEGVKDDVIETLKEIQDYINSDVAAAATMLKNIEAAQTRADNAYAYAGVVGGVADAAASTAGQAYVNAGTAYDRASAAYTYASEVGAVADGAQTRADNAYAYAGVVGAVADGALTAAGSAHDRADAAYTYASQVGAVADKALSYAQPLNTYVYNTVAPAVDAAYYLADAAMNQAVSNTTYVTSNVAALNKRIQDIVDAGIDTESVNNIIGDYLKDTDLSTDIDYSVAFASSETGYFISGVTVTRKGAGNDYDFAFTYSYIPSPKAEDYWEEYVPADTIA